MANPSKYKDQNVITGSAGKLYVDGILIAEVTAFTATVAMNKADVQIGYVMGKKVTSYEGSGTMTLNKVYSDLQSYLATSGTSGHDPRFTVQSVLADVDAVNGQVEMITIQDVGFNSNPIGWTQGDVVTLDIDFHFDPSSLKFDSVIDSGRKFTGS